MRPGDTEQRDGLVNGPARRRGAGLNPGNRFETVRLHVLGEERERRRVESPNDPSSLTDAPPADVPVELIADHSRTIINHVAPTSDDLVIVETGCPQSAITSRHRRARRSFCSTG
jgi:hypothetical protein